MHQRHKQRKSPEESPPVDGEKKEEEAEAGGASLPARRKAELLLRAEGNREVFMKLLYATVLMIVVPVPTYFLVYHGSGWAGLVWQDNVKAIAGGVAAVCMVQAIIIGYVVAAFRE